MYKILIGITFLFFTKFSLCEAATIDVTDYGANPNDGTDDKAAIQNAINAGASGDTIYFPSGIFLIGGTLTFNPNLTYSGQTGAILSETHSSSFVASTVYNDGVNITITNLVFDKGGFDFSGAYYQASNVNVLHCTFQNITATNYPWNDGIYIPIGLKNSQICNNLFTNIMGNVGNTGIAAWNMDSVQINDNWFDTVNEGAHLDGNDTNVSVLRNTGVHMHRMGIECQGIHINLLVQDNHFSHWINNYYDSFGLSIAASTNSANIVCRDNTVLARPLTGDPQSSHYGYGIESAYVTTRDNDIEGYWSVGISIGGPYCLITNNTLRGPENFNQYTHPLFIQFNPGSNPTNTTTVINNTQINTSSYIEPPAKLAAVASSPSSVELTWSDDSDNETGFKVERKVLGGDYAVVATLGANVTSYSDAPVSSGTQYVYRIQPYNAIGKTYSHVVLVTTPSDVGILIPSWQNTDIGNVGVVGGTSYSGGVFTVSGSGDIVGTADTLQYVYQNGGTNCAIIAQVTSQQNTDPWAKAGVMIRETLNAGSKFAMMSITPGNGFRFMDRTSTGSEAPASMYGGALAAAPNNWVKLARTNNLFTAYQSINGTTWTQVASVNITMADSIYIGLEVSSHSSTTSTATFDNVEVMTQLAWPPVLNIQLTTTNTVQISWPTAAGSDWVLCRRDNLAGSETWSAMTNLSAVIGQNYIVSDSCASNVVFYRLEQE